MNPPRSVFRAIRAVGCVFAARKVRSLVGPFAIGALAVGGASIWLVHFSWWWLVLTLPVFLAILVGVGLLVAASLAVRAFSPKLSAEQRQAVNGFADKLQRVSEGVQVPVFIIVYRVVRDIVRPRENGFIGQLAKDSTSLSKDFVQLQKLFVD